MYPFNVFVLFWALGLQSIHRWKGILDAGTWRVYNLLSDNTTARNDFCLMRLEIGQAPLTD